MGMYGDYWSSDRETWLKQVDEAFRSFKEAGIDAVYFLAKDPWGYVYYESKYAPLTKIRLGSFEGCCGEGQVIRSSNMPLCKRAGRGGDSAKLLLEGAP